MSTEALVHQQPKDLAVTQEQLAIARNTVAKGLTDDEFEVYLYNCKRQGVHPFDHLIIPIPRNDDGQRKLTFVTTVDLLRSRADETGDYAGSDDPLFDDYNDKSVPSKATVTVWKFVHGEKCSFTATARYDEYYPGEKQGFMWRSKPHVMLGKCAEGLALRKAFPKQLAGLYLEEELQKDSKPRALKPAPPPVGNVKCSECNAVGGHLPKCSKRQGANTESQPEAKPDNVMCGDCGQVNSHAPECKYAKQPTAMGAKTFQKSAVLILGVEHKLKAADRSGKREPFVVMRVVNNANEEFDLCVWHKTPQEFLVPAVIDKTMLCEFSTGKKLDGTLYYSVEVIHEIGGVKFSDNKPVV